MALQSILFARWSNQERWQIFSWWVSFAPPEGYALKFKTTLSNLCASKEWLRLGLWQDLTHLETESWNINDINQPTQTNQVRSKVLSLSRLLFHVAMGAFRLGFVWRRWNKPRFRWTTTWVLPLLLLCCQLREVREVGRWGNSHLVDGLDPAAQDGSFWKGLNRNKVSSGEGFQLSTVWVRIHLWKGALNGTH